MSLVFKNMHAVNEGSNNMQKTVPATPLRCKHAHTQGRLSTLYVRIKRYSCTGSYVALLLQVDIMGGRTDMHTTTFQVSVSLSNSIPLAHLPPLAISHSPDHHIHMIM